MLFALALAAPQPVAAQPFGAWLTLPGDPSSGYVRVPSHSSLNPSGAITLEAWVAVSNTVFGADCRSILGKNYLLSYWLGICNVAGQPTLRSYLKGAASLKQGGIVPRGEWTHVAVTFDGSKRRHYINGELAAEFSETGPLPSSASELRIGSDVSYAVTPAGAIDEVRLWNVARTTSQIRSTINVRIDTPQPGLVAVWPLDGSGADVIGPRDGSVQGSAAFLNGAVALDCGTSTATSLCLRDHFDVRAQWRTNPTPGTPFDGDAHIVPYVDVGSGLFWFFNVHNWEVLVKVLDGCALNDRFWVFSAATTNVYYQLAVTDVHTGDTKRYFNYPGPPAPAVIDTAAFATCP